MASALASLSADAAGRQLARPRGHRVRPSPAAAARRRGAPAAPSESSLNFSEVPLRRLTRRSRGLRIGQRSSTSVNFAADSRLSSTAAAATCAGAAAHIYYAAVTVTKAAGKRWAAGAPRLFGSSSHKTLSTGANGQKADGTSPFASVHLRRHCRWRPRRVRTLPWASMVT